MTTIAAHRPADNRRRENTPPEALEAPETAPAQELGHSNPEAAPFVPDTEEKVDWVLGKIADARAKAARIRANADIMAKQAEAEADRLEWQFGPALQTFLREQLAGGKRKSLTLFHGTLGFRTVAAGVIVGNEGEALAWAKAHLPEAVTERVDKAALTKALLSSGEVVDFAAFTPEDQKFFIKQAAEKPSAE